jgi:MOSC domain-containing protein YiiM/GNAT superfamily N-acetyltransferase
VGTTGRVLQVNVSPGGVPKLPVERAQVGRLGLEGDGHNDRTVHGGPHRAVCLFGIEAIDRLRADGHPVEPGSVGENLTTSGVEWSLLPVGSRARIGTTLELELASDAGPCDTQAHNFREGKYSRMSIELHPSDSRMYARVTSEGEVRPGDVITILPPPADSRAGEELLLDRLDNVEGRSSLAAWRAAADGGFDVRINADGELVMAASSDLPGPAFNHVIGLARLPNLISEATDFYDENRCVGWLTTDCAPWPGAQAELVLGTYAARPEDVADAELPDGVSMRRLRPDEGARLARMFRASGEFDGGSPAASNPWPVVYAALAAHPHRVQLIVERGGEAVGIAALHTRHRAAWMRGVWVAPAERGKGIQGAAIAARARLAGERGCDLIGASAAPGDASARNLERMGLRLVGTREHYRYVPPGLAA